MYIFIWTPRRVLGSSLDWRNLEQRHGSGWRVTNVSLFLIWYNPGKNHKKIYYRLFVSIMSLINLMCMRCVKGKNTHVIEFLESYEKNNNTDMILSRFASFFHQKFLVRLNKIPAGVGMRPKDFRVFKVSPSHDHK